MSNHFDVIVIGSGPGGEGACMRAAKEGKRVAVVDEFPTVGGSCTHLGTIPTKALRQSVQRILDYGSSYGDNYQELLRTADSVIDKQVRLRRGFYERNDVEIINGRAEFADEKRVRVALHDGGSERYSADYFVIASGSRPYHPPDVDFSHPRVRDSDTILALDENPKSVAIYGAGVIGCEYASIFRGLQIKTNLINTRDRLLSFLDDEITDALSYHLREHGALIRHNEEYERVEADDEGATIYLKSNKQIRADYLLWAQGRTGNSDNMGLEAIGVETDRRGAIKIHRNHQTEAHPHIYAVGDVSGFPSLASAAYDQGRFAATHLLFGEAGYQLVENIPTGIYTIPEISSIGETERELTEKKTPYEVGHAFFKHLARAQITERTTGMLKLLFHRDSLEVLGIHCFGANAAEIIHIGQAIMARKGKANSIMYFINTTFNYPTMAEAYRVAALNGINRVSRSKV